LVESLIREFRLVADHPFRVALDARAEPARPAAVRDVMELIETCPQMPLTTTLAMHCHVSVRTLQEGFRRHLGMSPMAYKSSPSALAHRYHRQSVFNLRGCDAMRRTGNFPVACSRSALSGQGFALCDVVA
jgi:AraC-like DNA-binding protein